MTGEGLMRMTILQEPMEVARLDPRRLRGEAPQVLYVARDDGVILRLEEQTDGSWAREIIYAGPIGRRGVVAGRFYEDPEWESVAVYGYSKKVQILSRSKDGPWRVETVFTDSDRGHWLSRVEMDGRNATDELVGCGFSNRVFILGRRPGYGLPGVPTETDKQPRKGQAAGSK